jgi:hypothetical protein
MTNFGYNTYNQRKLPVRKKVGKGYGRVNMVQILCTHCINGKMRPVETIPGIGEGEVKNNDRGG